MAVAKQRLDSQQVMGFHGVLSSLLGHPQPFGARV